MRAQVDNGEIVNVYKGKGTIKFPRGGSIQSYFELTEYSSGKRLLTCTGRFSKTGYAGWEQLVSHYQVESHISNAKQAWRAEHYEGRTDTEQQLTIQQMFLINSRVSEVLSENLTLEMQFDCADVVLAP